MIPRPRFALVLAAAAVATVIFGVRTGMWMVAAAIVAGVYDIVRLRTEVSGRRFAEEIVARGYETPLRLEIHPGSLRVVRLRQPIPPAVELDVDEIQASELSTAMVATVRGRHSLPAAVARVEGPFGMVGRDHEVAAAHDVIVYPDVITANRIAREILRGRFTVESARRRGALGLGTEFESIRDYLPGDEVRRVNWPATLRSGRPMTNQYRLEQDREVLCVIDAGRLLRAPTGSLTRLDSAVDAATAIAYAADAVGDRVGAVAFDRTVLRRTVPRRAGGRAVVEAIYDLQPSDLESDYEQAFRVAGRMKRALVMLFTDLLEPAAARPLIDAMPVLTRRHKVVVVSTRDDDLRAAVADGSESVEAAYRAMAALDATEAKALVVGRLHHLGATVVEAPVGSLPAACVAAYLKAKSLARL